MPGPDSRNCRTSRLCVGREAAAPAALEIGASAGVEVSGAEALVEVRSVAALVFVEVLVAALALVLTFAPVLVFVAWLEERLTARFRLPPVLLAVVEVLPVVTFASPLVRAAFVAGVGVGVGVGGGVGVGVAATPGV